jgi:UDP:flavonoid glycosyltransferase YjiC (YdhE family)
LFTEAGLDADRVPDALSAPIFSLTPPSLEEPQHRDIGMRIRAGDTRPHDRGAARKRPLVYVTLGSEAARAGLGLFPHLYRAIIDALAGSGVDLLVAVGRSADPTALDPLPPGVRVERWVDQDDILGSASAVVFHGGYGTMIAALTAGTPLVGVPLFSIDQRVNSERVGSIGAGLALEGPADLDQLAAARDRVLHQPEFSRRAQAIASEIANLAPITAAIDRLETLASR